MFSTESDSQNICKRLLEELKLIKKIEPITVCICKADATISCLEEYAILSKSKVPHFGGPERGATIQRFLLQCVVFIGITL